MGDRLWLGVLGPLELRLGDTEPVTLGGLRQRAVLAILTLQANEVVSTERLVDALWGEHPPTRALHTVHVFVSRLRRVLGARADRLRTRQPGYVLELQTDADPDACELDVHRCERLCLAAEAARHRGELQTAAALLDRARSQWRGSPLAEFTYYDFAQDAIRTFESLRVRCREELIDVQLALGHHGQVTSEAESLVREEPLRERPHGQRMLALYRCGRHAEALDAYRHACRELGSGPSDSLRRLQDAIVSQDPGLNAPSGFPEVVLTRRPAPSPTPRAAPGREPAQVPGERGVHGRTARPPVPLPPALRSRADAPLYGRGGQLERLAGWWQHDAGGVRLCVLSGDAGIGKTRLAAALARTAHAAGVTVLYGRCDDGGPPYQPLVETVRQLVKYRPPITVGASPDALTELARLVPDLQPAGEPAGAPANDPALRRHLLFDSVARLFADAARDCDVLLVIDDLHLADDPTAALLGHLLRTDVPGRLGVIGIHREAELSPARDIAAVLDAARRELPYEHVALGALDFDSVNSLVDAAVAEGATPEFVRAIHDRTGGNPLFLEEVLNSIAGSGRSGGRRVDPQDLVRAGVPQGVQVVLARRLKRLGEDVTETLADAAIIGPEFRLDVLEALMEGVDPLAPIERALQAGLIVERGNAGRLAFAHAIVHDAIYHLRTARRRARIHLRLATLLQQEPRLGASAAEVARHWTAAEQPAPAVKALLAAARDATAVSAHAEARRYYHRCLALWPRASGQPDEALRSAGVAGEPTPASVREILLEAGPRVHRLRRILDQAAAATGECLGQVLEEAAEASRWAGEPGAAADFIGLAMAVSELEHAPGDARRARLQERLGRYLWEAGNWDASAAAYEAALRVLEALPPSIDAARALAGQAALLMLRERYAASFATAEEALRVARAAGARREEGHALNTVGVDLGMSGRSDEGINALREALRIAEEVKNLEDQCRAYCNLSELLIRSGRTAEAAETALSGYRFARRHGLQRSGAPIVAANAVAALASLGRWAEAERLAAESLADTLPDGVSAYLRLVRAQLMIMRGDSDRGRTQLEQAAAIVTDAYEPTLVVELQAARAEEALGAGDRRRARAAVEAALGELSRSGEDEEGGPTLRLCALGLRVAGRGEQDDDREWAGELVTLAQRIRLRHGEGLLPAAAAFAITVDAAWAALERRDDAVARWESAVAAWEALGHVHDAARARLALAEALMEDGRPETAKPVLDEVIKLAQRLGAAPLQREATRATALAQPSAAPVAVPDAGVR